MKKSIYEFLTNKVCEKKYSLAEFFGSELNKVTNSLIKEVVNLDKPIGDILKELEVRYNELTWESKKSKELAIKNDSARLVRFYNYLKDNIGTILDRNKYVYYEVEKDMLLEQYVPLIYKSVNGDTVALVYQNNASNISVQGKIAESRALYDLYSLIPKISLENEYPEIKILHLFLRTSGEDKKGVEPKFVDKMTKDGNIFFYDYENNKNFKEKDKEFSMDYLHKITAEAINLSRRCDCSTCFYERYCKSESLEQALYERPVLEDKVKVGNTLAKDQKIVAETVEGNMVVCAGPGAGKTYTLVNRVYNVLQHYPASKILVVTFANEAVKEIINRLTAMGIEDMPIVSTIHAHAWEILQECEEILGYKPELLTPDRDLKLMQEYIDLGPDLEMSYANFDGKHGIVKTMLTALNQYRLGHTKDLSEDKKIFLNGYTEYAHKKNLITFDEVIEEVNKLFDNNKELREAYQSNYDAIMVDEYQDVDALQHKFILNLSNNGENNNLVVFGDDDQAIYQFKNGNSYYMRSLAKQKNFTVYTLSKNYRCGSKIVSFASLIAEKADFRIPKKSIPTRGDFTGYIAYSPEPDLKAKELEATVKMLIDKGYDYGDIVVLSRDNESLEKLVKEVSFPSVLEKRKLEKTALVRIILSGIEGLIHGNSGYLTIFFNLLGIDFYGGINDVHTLFEGEQTEKIVIANKVSEAIKNISSFDKETKVKDIVKFVETIASYIKLHGSNEEVALMNQIVTLKLEDFDGLTDYLRNIVKFSSSERVKVEQKDRVLFSTSFDAKGKEWPCVILLSKGDISINDESETKEDKLHNLFVSVTRAKDCFVFQGNGFESIRNAAANSGIDIDKFVS